MNRIRYNEDRWVFQCCLNASAKGHMFSRDQEQPPAAVQMHQMLDHTNCDIHTIMIILRELSLALCQPLTPSSCSI